MDPLDLWDNILSILSNSIQWVPIQNLQPNVINMTRVPSLPVSLYYPSGRAGNTSPNRGNQEENLRDKTTRGGRPYDPPLVFQ